MREQLELLRRESDDRVAHGDTPCSPVDGQVVRDEHLGGRRPAPSEQRADTSQQLLVGERPSDDVVRSAIESADALDRIGRRREEDDRDVPVPASARLTATEAETEVELGEKHEIGVRALDEIERLASPRGPEHVEAVVAQLSPEVLASR